VVSIVAPTDYLTGRRTQASENRAIFAQKTAIVKQPHQSYRVKSKDERQHVSLPRVRRSKFVRRGGWRWIIKKRSFAVKKRI
jgi:hypothetical protein